MTNITTGTQVTAHRGTLSMGGMFITETNITGTIEKVNKKSIRVRLTHINVTRHGKASRSAEVLTDWDMNETATFTYWKTVDKKVGDWTSKETVQRVFYKNARHGIIEF